MFKYNHQGKMDEKKFLVNKSNMKGDSTKHLEKVNLEIVNSNGNSKFFLFIYFILRLLSYAFKF